MGWIPRGLLLAEVGLVVTVHVVHPVHLVHVTIRSDTHWVILPYCSSPCGSCLSSKTFGECDQTERYLLVDVTIQLPTEVTLVITVDVVHAIVPLEVRAPAGYGHIPHTLVYRHGEAVRVDPRLTPG